MPRFGAHVSIAARVGSAIGGFALAVDRASELACQSMQIFSKPPTQWAAPPPDRADIAAFRRKSAEAGLAPLLGHTIYLINLASPDDAVYEKSRRAFLEELDRAESLGLDFLITHPGAHRGAGEQSGLRRIADALTWLHSERKTSKVQILLETTAGQGTALCGRLEHLAYLIENVKDAERLGICFDTCHMFAAGYDIKSQKGHRSTLRQIDELVGLNRVKAIHLNDSKGACGSRLDRHEHIGKGRLGTAAFRRIVNEPVFAHLPMIIETPKTDSRGKQMDAANLRLLRRLARQKS